jgi:hypothetical protein
MLTFYFSDKPLGASTAYARVAGLVGRLFAPRHTDALPFYAQKAPAIDWQVMLVAGILLGGFLAAWTGAAGPPSKRIRRGELCRTGHFPNHTFRSRKAGFWRCASESARLPLHRFRKPG